jgi:uncharacterized protein (TIGR03435 family)
VNRHLGFAGVLLAAPSMVWAADQAAFDVVSVKLHRGEVTFSADPAIRGRSVRGTASTLIDLITYAYGVRYDQISGGPAWAASEHYDVDAKSEGEGVLTPAQSRNMFQSLLADRFQLKLRHETQKAPVYALVVGKNGPKFKEAAPDATGGSRTTGGAKGNHMDVKRGTMDGLADQLAFTAGRPVINKTGLTGFYAFTLDWFPADRIAPADLDVPSMFAAVQEQLGLKLEPAKAPVAKLVIESAERPKEN